MKILKKYFPFIKLSIIRSSTYKHEVWWGSIISFVIVIFYFYLWKSIFGNSSAINGYTFEEIMNYYIFSRIILMFIRNDFDRTLEYEIKNGTISIRLIRPSNIFLEGWSSSAGLSIWRLILNILPIIITGMIFFNIQIRITLVSTIYLILILFCAFFINYMISFIVGILTFWSRGTTGVRHLKSLFISVIGGSLIPLDFYPAKIYNLFMFFPFKYLIYYPVLLLQGKLNESDILTSFPVLVLWIIIFLGICITLNYMAKRKIIIFGG